MVVLLMFSSFMLRWPCSRKLLHLYLNFLVSKCLNKFTMKNYSLRIYLAVSTEMGLKLKVWEMGFLNENYVKRVYLSLMKVGSVFLRLKLFILLGFDDDFISICWYLDLRKEPLPLGS